MACASLKSRLGALVAALLIALYAPMMSAQTCGNPGQDGPGTISGVVNTYYPAANSTQTVAAGATSIALGAAATDGSTTPIASGDMVLVIQMQDATINTSNNSNYGAGNGTGTGLTGGTAGFYEFAIATNAVPISGGTLTIAAGLTNTYSNAPYGTQGQKRFQVVRVPQYASATLGSVSAAAWNGSTGGIVAFDVAGSLNLGGGTINASGKGFRGGGGVQYTGGTGTDTDYRRPVTQGWGGSKGEGVAGTPRAVYDGVATVSDTGVEGYVNGSFERGAPGNAGGGAGDGDPANNDENAGGGGGGNGGDGGHGGNSWNSNLAVGGVGGDTFASSSSRVVLGGGGGAGSDNNTVGYRSSGAGGGGVVILRVGSVTGSGVIQANGSDAPDPDNDGGGGGGAGGSVVVLARSGALTGLTINANGGRGSDTWTTQTAGTNNINAHGPGGGGGGGAVYQSGGASVTVTGGAHGTTTTAALTYNAVSGSTGISAGVTAGGISGALQGAACLPSLTVTKSTTTPTVGPGGSVSYKITVKNAASVSAAAQVSISDTLPQPVTSGFTFTSTTSVTLSGGATRPSSTNPTANATVPAWSAFTIPAGGQVDVTFVVKIATNVPTGTYQNPATATYLDPTRTSATGTTSASYDPASSTNEDVTVRIMLAGTVFADLNHDGNQDSGEDWSAGTSLFVNLVQSGAVVQSVNVTAGTGTFSFGSAAAGSYTLVLTNSATSTTPTAPSGWIATMPTPQSYTFTLNSNPILNLNFGLFNGTKVSGTAFQDDGSGSGTANNGAQDGGEVGLTNVTVKATDTGSTIYDQTTTDASGHYTLWLPASATSVRVTETNSSGYVSTGASVGNSGGTYSRTTDTISFTNAGLVYTGLNFGEVLNSTLSPNGSLQTLPNTSVFYSHSFVATTTGQVTLSTADVASPNNIRGYSAVLYRDTNCNGQLDSGETQISGAISVTVGTTVCFLVKEFVPGSAPFDATDSVTVTASFALTNAAPTLTLSYTATDITTVGQPKDAGLRLEKAVDKATATPGTVITYTITYTNDSSGSLSSIVINDATPAYTLFQSASCGTPLPTGVTGCSVTTQPGSGATGTIQWTLTGNMNSAQSGTVSFSVKVD